MDKYDVSIVIVRAVLKDLAGRKGLDIEELIDDNEIYLQLVTELEDIVFEIIEDWKEADGGTN